MRGVALVSAPDGFLDSTLAPLPDQVELRSRARGPLDVIVFFTKRRAELERRFDKLVDALDRAGALWVAWPKGSSGVTTDLTENSVRDVAPAEGTRRHQGLRDRRHMVGPEARDPQGEPLARSPMADPVFLITGASSGIGAATARHAAREGYRLVLAARSEDKIAALAARARRGPRARGALRRHRVGGPAAHGGRGARRVRAARRRVRERRLRRAARLPRVDVEHWRAMVLTNVYGAALTIRATLPAVRETRGHVLLTGSVAGRRALPGSLYSATKWAVTAMGEALRQEVDGTGIRVTLIEPGMVDTPFFDNRPQGALEADDIARAVMFAVAQPPHVDVNEILVRPTAQSGVDTADLKRQQRACADALSHAQEELVMRSGQEALRTARRLVVARVGLRLDRGAAEERVQPGRAPGPRRHGARLQAALRARASRWPRSSRRSAGRWTCAPALSAAGALVSGSRGTGRAGIRSRSQR